MHVFFKKYFFIDNFDTKILDYQDKQTSIIYRNYHENIINLRSIIKLRNYCKKKKIKFYIANNIKLALRLNADGAYIPSFNKSITHLNYSFNKNFDIIGSAHNLNEIRIKERQRVNKIVLSSLFKKNKNYLGIYRFKILKKLTKKKLIVLGGVTKNNLKKINLVDCNNFAGISYFKKKGL
tara:strand:- start:237 stop:776 length:540 start_codon:yes stop_codon:yes gene_type:complete